MRIHQLDYNFKYRLILVALFSLSASIPFIDWVGYSEPDLLIKTLAVCIFVLFYSVCYFLPLITVILPLFFGVIAILYNYDFPLIVNWVGQITAMPQPADALFWPLIFIGLITFAFFITARLKHVAIIFFILGVFYFPALWYLHVDSAYLSSIFYSVSWLLLVSHAKGYTVWQRLPLHGSLGEEVKDFRQNWTGYTITVILLAILITILLPKNIAPLPAHSLHRWLSEKIPCIEGLRGAEDTAIRGDGEEFSFYSFGFLEGSALGGPLILDERTLLLVEGAGGLYLKGSVQDVYTGTSWIKSDSMNAMQAYPQPPDAIKENLVEVEVTIRHVSLRTNTIFTMLYPSEVSKLPGLMLIDHNGALYFPASIPLRHKYNVNGYVLVSQPNYALWETSEELYAFEHYLTLPDDLPGRVTDLSLDITAGEHLFYNRMKLLQSYLFSYYSYNTAVPPTPSNRDFTDFFLFEGQEGYCTYFATALAVMGRAAGVPTRFVSGFIVPQEKEEEGLYALSGMNAHAWVEAYIPGIGWVPFEATPGFRLPGSLYPLSDTGDVAGSETDEMIDPAFPFTEDDLDHFTGSAFGDEQPALFSVRNLFRLLSRLVLYAALGLLLFSVSYILYYFFKLKKLTLTIKKQPSYLKVANYYLLILYLLDKISLGKAPGETPLDYSGRIIGKVHSFTINFKELSDGVNLALYSKEPVSEVLAEKAELFFYDVLERYMAQSGLVKAFFEIILSSRKITALIYT